MRRAKVQQTKSGINAAEYIVLEVRQTAFEVSSNYISKELMTPLRMRDSDCDYSFRRNILQGAVSVKQYDVMDLYKGDEKQGYIGGNAVFLSGFRTYTPSSVRDVGSPCMMWTSAVRESNCPFAKRNVRWR
ncbi:MAG: hypothetical protein RRY79_05395 [Clostridia bacterium]